MKLTISRIYKRGVPNEERLIIKVLNDTNLSYYVVLDTVYTSPQTLSTVPKRAYWFAPKSVKAGDQVSLYTKVGVPSQKQLNDGSTAHFLYWGLTNVIWDKTGNCAVLMELNSWQTSPYE